MHPDSAATFDRQTRVVKERQGHEPDEPEPEPEPHAVQHEKGKEEVQVGDTSRGFGVRCCISARAGLGIASVVQLGLSAGSVFTVAPTWPSRPGLLAWQCVVLFAVWLSAAMENRSVATASFIALSAGSAALLALWSAAQPPRLLCEQTFQHSCVEGTRDDCCYRCTGFHRATSPSVWEAGCFDRMVVEGKFCWYPVREPNHACLFVTLAADPPVHTHVYMCWRCALNCGGRGITDANAGVVRQQRSRHRRAA